MTTIGVYEITNVVNGKHYFGSNNIKRRWIDHKKRLRNNTHDNCYLQWSWNKYGEKSFTFSVVEVCPEADLLAAQQKYIDDFKKSEKLYNLSLVAGKIEMTPEIRKRIGDGNRGKVRSEETKKLLSDINTGVKNPMFGKITPGNLGKKFSKEWCQKIGTWNKGKIVSDETKQKIRNSLLGRKQSDETKLKRKNSIKRFYENSDVRKLHGNSVRAGYENMTELNRQKHRDSVKKSWVLRKLEGNI